MQFKLYKKFDGVSMAFVNDDGDTLSVIKTSYAMCDEDTFEIWLMDEEDEPRGYVSYEKVEELVNKHLNK